MPVKAASRKAAPRKAAKKSSAKKLPPPQKLSAPKRTVAIEGVGPAKAKKIAESDVLHFYGRFSAGDASRIEKVVEHARHEQRLSVQPLAETLHLGILQLQDRKSVV